MICGDLGKNSVKVLVVLTRTAMLTRKNFYPFIFILIFIGGCVPPQESTSLQNEIITLKNELRSVQTRLDVATESEKNKDKKIDVTKAIRDLGHDPKITLKQGIPKTIEWMKEVYKGGTKV